MGKVKNQELLKDERVQQEINRHRWIESEKAGTDIGFDKASTDWLTSFSDSWLEHHGTCKTEKVAKPAPKRSAKTMGRK
jgi:hypothetical protein